MGIKSEIRKALGNMPMSKRGNTERYLFEISRPIIRKSKTKKPFMRRGLKKIHRIMVRNSRKANRVNIF